MCPFCNIFLAKAALQRKFIINDIAIVNTALSVVPRQCAQSVSSESIRALLRAIKKHPCIV